MSFSLSFTIVGGPEDGGDGKFHSGPLSKEDTDTAIQAMQFIEIHGQSYKITQLNRKTMTAVLVWEKWQRQR